MPQMVWGGGEGDPRGVTRYRLSSHSNKSSYNRSAFVSILIC